MEILDKIKSQLNALKNNPKQMMIAISAVIALTVFAYLNFALKPQIVNIISVRSKLGKAATGLKSAKIDIAKIGEMRRAVDSYNNKITEHEKALPSEDKIPALLESLSEKAKNAEMRIVGIVPMAVKEIDGTSRVYRKIPINITAKAGYHELGHFLSSIENSDRFIKVTNIQIRGDKSSPRMHNVDLTVVAYVMQGSK